jgi:hypothetical protein
MSASCSRAVQRLSPLSKIVVPSHTRLMSTIFMLIAIYVDANAFLPRMPRPPGMPHLPANFSSTEPCIAVTAGTDPNEQEIEEKAE